MENASKALIIAGAILLAILIISLGIMILNQAQDTINGSGMTQAEIQAFNSKFTKYEGNRRGSVVRSLLQEVVSSNGTQENKDAKRLISVTYGTNKLIDTKDDGTSTVNSFSSIKNTSTYTVSFTYDNSGCVKTITIADKT